MASVFYEMTPKHEIIVGIDRIWVNGADGSCIARFSRFGIDIHRTTTAQMAGESECLDCSHGRPGLAEWDRFKTGMLRHYGIAIADSMRPSFLDGN